MTTTNKPSRGRGFASLSPEERSRVARIGGKAAWKQGVAYRWTSEEAAIAGRKGVAARLRNQRRGFKEEL